jgi:hypothetical protein
MSLTRHDPGAVLRLRDGEAPYGTVMAYDAAHRFHTGRPTPAYEIRLPSGETVWLSARVVAKGMVAMESPGAGR